MKTRRPIPRKKPTKNTKPAEEVELVLVEKEGAEEVFVRLDEKLTASESDSQVKLKVVDGDDSQGTEVEESVVKLEPVAIERGGVRSHQPEVSDIIDNEDESVEMEDAWGERTRLPPMGWFALLGILFVGLGVWASYSVYQAQPETEVIIIENKFFIEEGEKEKQEANAMHVGMQECVKSYLAATNIAELLPHVRFPERVEPLMQKYYQKHGRRKTEFRHFEQMRSLNIGKRSFVHAKVQLESGEYYHLLVEQLDTKTFKVDWESDVFYQPMPWEDYCEKRPLKPVDMRVRVSPDDFYGFAFRDKEKYQCYQLTTLGSDRFLYGYVERGSAVALKLKDYFDQYEKSLNPPVHEKEENDRKQTIAEKIAQKGQVKKRVGKKGRAMILRIRFILDDKSKFCVKIDDLVCIGWAYIESTDALLLDLDLEKP